LASRVTRASSKVVRRSAEREGGPPPVAKIVPDRPPISSFVPSTNKSNREVLWFTHFRGSNVQFDCLRGAHAAQRERTLQMDDLGLPRAGPLPRLPLAPPELVGHLPFDEVLVSRSRFARTVRRRCNEVVGQYLIEGRTTTMPGRGATSSRVRNPRSTIALFKEGVA